MIDWIQIFVKEELPMFEPLTGEDQIHPPIPLVHLIWITLWRLTYMARHKLLHSRSLVARGLSVGYETWPHAFVIGWSESKLGLPRAPLHYGLAWPVRIPTVCQTPLTFHLHSLNGRQMPDCERRLWKSQGTLQGDSHSPDRCVRIEGFCFDSGDQVCNRGTDCVMPAGTQH